ncbi:MAG: hypothetical protein AAGB22_03965 [Bacteroidota bacterium]
MKKTLTRSLLPLLFISCGILAGCNGSQGNAEGDETPAATEAADALPEELQGNVELDISEFGLPMVVRVPDESRGVPEVIEQSWGETEVRVGGQFQLRIAFGGDVAAAKADVQGDLARNTTIVEEGDNFFIYRWDYKDAEYIQSEFHFYLLQEVGGEVYEIQDVQGEETYSEAAVRVMFEAARHVEAKPAS